MAPGGTIPRERIAPLQQIYDDLCMRLNTDDETKNVASQILSSDSVQPFFKEYRRDYLEVIMDLEHVGCNELFGWCRSTDAFTSPKYTDPKVPDKAGWIALDHAARFLVRVLRFSWDNGGEWDHGKFDPDNDQNLESDSEFYQVWSILRYLQIEWEAANLEEWEADLFY
ncbi:hypothetical protein AAE478_001326 [Parahypoxylon ruwenzoriense]